MLVLTRGRHDAFKFNNFQKYSMLPHDLYAWRACLCTIADIPSVSWSVELQITITFWSQQCKHHLKVCKYFLHKSKVKALQTDFVFKMKCGVSSIRMNDKTQMCCFQPTVIMWECYDCDNPNQWQCLCFDGGCLQ